MKLSKLQLSLLLAIYIAAVFLGVYNHEPWRDEAQAWLLARDMSLFQLFHTLPSEGHPPLWYLLIMPMAKAGLPYISQNYLDALIMAGAMYLLLFRSELPVLFKLLLPFSYYMFYEYAEIARNYCLIAFFLALIISLYPRRFGRTNSIFFALAVVGLFNSHVLIFAFACGLILLYVWDMKQGRHYNKHTFIALAIMCIGGLYLLPWLGSAHIIQYYQGQADDPAKNIMSSITHALLISGDSSIALLILAVLSLLLAYRVKPLLLLVFGLTGALYILGFKYTVPGLRHDGIIFLVLLGSYALAMYYKPANEPKILKLQYGQYLLVAIMAFQLVASASAYSSDINNSFSYSADAADYLKQNSLDTDIIVGSQAWAVSALAPYLPGKKIYYAECQRYGTYYIYDSCFMNNKWAYPPGYSIHIAHDNFKDSLSHLVFVFNNPAGDEQARYLELLYSSPDKPIRSDEAYYIYKFRNNVK